MASTLVNWDALITVYETQTGEWNKKNNKRMSKGKNLQFPSRSVPFNCAPTHTAGSMDTADDVTHLPIAFLVDCS